MASESITGTSDPLARETAPLAQEIYRKLLSRMIAADLEPDARVTIDAVAREFGVSPTPVREALGRLEQDGLVVRHLNAGYRVAPLMTRAQFDDLTEIRLALEPLCARNAARLASREEVAALQSLADDSSRRDDVTDREAYAAFAQGDAALHNAIASAGRNEMIRDALERLHIHVRLFRLIYRARIRTDALAEHQSIVDAIRSGDGDAAAYEMRRHLERSRERFVDSFQPSGSDTIS